MSAPDIDPLDDEIGRGGVPRDRYDRALLVPPGGGEREPYTAMSTLAKQLGSNYALHRHQLRVTAMGVGASRELTSIAGSSRYSTAPGERDEGLNRSEGYVLDDVVNRAQEIAGANRKRDWGSGFHRYVEQEDPLGEPPLDMVPDIEAFRAKLKAAGIKILATELFVVNELLHAAGSFDYALLVPWRPGKIVIGDSKTGWKRLEDDEIQLWGYAGSEIYEQDTDTRISFEDAFGLPVDQELGYTIRTAAMSGETELYPLDLVSGKESAQLAAAVHRRNSRVQKHYRKVKPVDLDEIARDTVEATLLMLEELDGIPFAQASARLKELHREYRHLWTEEWSDRGRALLRARKAAAA